MIVKHMPLTAPQKSSFGRLAEYITDPQEKNVRVGIVSLTNCISNGIDLAVLEIRNTQAQNTRSIADKTYHLMVSFREGEQPDDATLEAIEERICNALGFAGHQRMSAVHHDTDNLHVHIAINKIHPSRYTIHEPFNAYHKLGQLAEKLEREFGLEADNHKPNKTLAENRTADMEHQSGVESLLGWLKRECKGQIEGAQSWESLHQVMRENGLQFHERANGLVITAENGVSVKASSVSRELSKGKLEQRYGAFQAAPEWLASVKPRNRYEKKPVASRTNTVELYARYQTAQATASRTRADEWAKAKAKKDRLIEAAKRSGRLKRAAIRLVSASGVAKKLMYMATSNALRDEINNIQATYCNERQEIYTRFQRRTWADWLRNQAMAGDREALGALRAREQATGLKGNTVAGKGGSSAIVGHFKHDSITKKGTIIYSVGASAVRDDGDKLKVSKGVDKAGLQVALRLAMERYGNRITINGSAAFKEKIARAAASANLPVTFDDEALERRRQQLTSPSTMKEKKHGNDSSGRGPVGRGAEQDRHGDARAAFAARSGARKPGVGHSIRPESDPTRVAKTAPSAARDGVRDLPELGVVQQPERGQVLLPGHVRGGVEHQGPESDHGLRRPVHRAGRVALPPVGGKATVNWQGAARPPLGNDPLQQLPRGGTGQVGIRMEPAKPSAPMKPRVMRLGTSPPPASKDRLQRLSQLGAIAIDSGTPTAKAPLAPSLAPVQVPPTTLASTAPKANARTPSAAGLQVTDAARAVAKYIADRDQKRALGFDIPKYARYTADNERTAIYAGLRRVDGQAMALFSAGDEVQVLPVDEATALRLKRISLGAQLDVSSKGAIKRKGRSR